MLRKTLVALAFAICGISANNATAQVNPFNPDYAWCNTQGSIAMRGATKWQCLTPGTNGQVLRSGGAGANAVWGTVTGTGTVSSVSGSGGTTGLSLSGGPITGAGTLTIGGTLATTSGGTGLTTFAAGDLIYGSGVNTLSKIGIGTTGQLLSVVGGFPSWTDQNNLSITATTGTASRTLSDHFRDILNVSDFGAVCNGTTDDSAAFNSAMAALPPLGGELRLPNSATSCVVNNVTITKAITLSGQGGTRGQSTISPASATVTALTIDGPFVTLNNIAFEPKSGVAKQTSGAFVHLTGNASRFIATQITMSEFYKGFDIVGTPSSVSIQGFRALLYTTSGGTSHSAISIDGVLDGRVGDFTIAGPGGAAAESGVRITESGDVVMSDGNIISMGRNLNVTPGDGEEVNSLWLSNVFLDAGEAGAWYEASGTGKIQRSKLSNTWAGSNSSHGMYFGAGTNGVDVTSPHTFLNGGDGISIGAGAKFVNIDGGQNAQNAGACVGVAADVSNFAVRNQMMGNVAGFALPCTFGVVITAGESDHYDISGNNMVGMSSTITDNGNGINKQIINNMGVDTYTMFRSKTNGVLHFTGTQANPFSGYEFYTDSGVKSNLLIKDDKVTIGASTLLQLPVTTVSALPTCNSGTLGALGFVSDASTPTWNSIIVGGGSVPVMAFCNGTNWTAH